MSRLARTLICVLVFVAAVGTARGILQATSQNVSNQPDQTTFLVCGQDQALRDAIPVSVANTILAGDGRLFMPCPGKPGQRQAHPLEHRESREGFELNEALRSSDPELHWRAVQALIRITLQPEADGSVDPRVPAQKDTNRLIVVQADGIGMLTHSMLIHGTCKNEAQVFNASADATRWQSGRFFIFLRDLPVETTPRIRALGIPLPDSNNPKVRSEAAYGLGVRLSRTAIDDDLLAAAMRELQACFKIMTGLSDSSTAGLILEALGAARYARDDQITEAESFLAGEAHFPYPQLVGAVTGLEALYRQHGQYPIREGALLVLRQLAQFGSQIDKGEILTSDARVRRLALMALQAARDHDTATLRAASLDTDWQVRRLVAGSLNLSDAEQVRVARNLAQDRAFQVRYDLLASVSRQVRVTHECAPFVPYFKDVSPAVVMRAMDLLLPSCTDLEEPVAKLIALTDLLAKPDAVYDWHVVARAVAALARVKPEAAQDALANAAKHEVWQMRATAAAASVDVKNDAIAVKLAHDKEPNVQTAALDALFRLRSTEVVPAAIAVLSNSEDYQALRMAAMVLKGLPAESKEDASNALLTALRKLTAHESDTSREPRVAIIERLAEALDPSRGFLLVPFATDFDDEVNAAVGKTLNAIGSFVPGDPSIKRRYPYQPTSGYPDKPDGGLLAVPPTTASLELDEGAVTVRLLSDVAPVTVARFAQLADRGYYTGLTFHRVVTNFFVQGGSPGANDFAGTSRFMRDEVGPQGVHVRGAVGMMTRGSDTGNAQIFIDLVDAPSLNRDYTVFGYVTGGMELVDKLLEGAIIRGVTIK